MWRSGAAFIGHVMLCCLDAQLMCAGVPFGRASLAQTEENKLKKQLGRRMIDLHKYYDI